MQGSGLSALGNIFTGLDEQGAFSGFEQNIKDFLDFKPGAQD